MKGVSDRMIVDSAPIDELPDELPGGMAFGESRRVRVALQMVPVIVRELERQETQTEAVLKNIADACDGYLQSQHAGTAVERKAFKRLLKAITEVSEFRRRRDELKRRAGRA